jgi:very-short-patch-repair endonuclease
MTKRDPLKKEGMHYGATPKVFSNAAKLRKNMTDPEKKLWGYLKTKPMGYKFRRQHPIAIYILDFYCHQLRLSIEVDGGYHLSKEQREIDKKRTNFLKSVGITEFRFTNQDILNHVDKSIEIITAHLRAASPLGAGGERRQKS